MIVQLLCNIYGELYTYMHPASFRIKDQIKTPFTHLPAPNHLSPGAVLSCKNRPIVRLHPFSFFFVGSVFFHRKKYRALIRSKKMDVDGSGYKQMQMDDHPFFHRDALMCVFIHNGCMKKRVKRSACVKGALVNLS